MRRLAAVLAAAVVAVSMSACAASVGSAGQKKWHDGRLYIATGNTTGVFYQLGGGYADLISQYLPGRQAAGGSRGQAGQAAHHGGELVGQVDRQILGHRQA